jgi:hypothetical protein
VLTDDVEIDEMYQSAGEKSAENLRFSGIKNLLFLKDLKKLFTGKRA